MSRRKAVPGESAEIGDMVNRAERLDELFDAASREAATPPVLEPGIYFDIPKGAYHADPCSSPSFSHSLARILLERSPAHAWAHHPKGGAQIRESTPEMDAGTMIDSLLLGGDQPFVESPFDDYRKKEAREWRDGAVKDGLLPVKKDDLLRFKVAAERIQANFRALGIRLGNEAVGKSQVTVIWDDMMFVVVRD